MTVNNVGKQYLYPMYLNEVNKNDLWDLININVGAVTMMTRLVLPIMIKNKKGAIINISSGAELQPLPLMTVYAATKVSCFDNFKKKTVKIDHPIDRSISNQFSFRFLFAISHLLCNLNIHRREL